LFRERFTLCTLLAIAILGSSVALGAAHTHAEASATQYPALEADQFREEHSLRILPRVELVSAVLLHTSWREEMGPTGPGNRYALALTEHFAPHSGHAAIHTAKALLERGFRYDAPKAFAIVLGPLPHLAAPEEYPRQLIARAGGQDILEEFRRELKDLAQTAEFAQFLVAEEEMLHRKLAESKAGYTPERVTAWMEDFYGYSADGYHKILAPAAFPAGGYGAAEIRPDDTRHVYSIARAAEGAMHPPQLPRGKDLEQLAIHEWGHSFSDPAVFAHPDKFRQLQAHYEPVSAIMSDQHYTTLEAFVQEQVLRGIDAFARRKIHGEGEYRMFLEQMEARGFYLTKEIVQELEYYTDNRDAYPTFSAFAPILLDRMAQAEPRRPSILPRIHPALWLRLLLGFASIIVLIWWVLIGIKRRRRQIEKMEDFPDIDHY